MLNMFRTDKSVILALLLVDAAAIVVGMVAGPLGHTAASIGASVSAGVISVAIVVYGFFVWKKHRR